MELPEPIRDLLAGWGLSPGRSLRGFTVARVGLSTDGGAVLVTFEREGTPVEVRMHRASDQPRFARIGGLDISYEQVDPSWSRDMARLMEGFAGWLKNHGADAHLAPLLAGPKPVTPTPPKVISPAADAHATAYADAKEAPDLDPAKEASATRAFMQFERIGLEDLHRYPDALHEMCAGRLGGLVIANVYDPTEMARVVERLEKGDARFPRTSFPERFKAHFFGRCLDGADPKLDEYLRDAALFREETLSVFEGSTPFERRMEEVFGALSGGRTVEVPRYEDGRAYTSATIRVLLEGGQIGTHCGNEASTRPAYTHLNGLIDRGDQISFFLTLQHPVGGGRLIVYSLKWSDIDASRIVGGRSQVEDLLSDAQWMAVATHAGDLLIFDGGRYFHRVEKVVGPRIRYTIGGFMMFDRAGGSIYYWS